MEQGRAQACESGLISLFHKALASSDLHALSVNLGWGSVNLAVPAMVTSFPAQEALSVATAWSRGGVGWERMAPKGISGAGVAKRAAVFVNIHLAGGPSPQQEAASWSLAYPIPSSPFRMPSGATGWGRGGAPPPHHALC